MLSDARVLSDEQTPATIAGVSALSERSVMSARLTARSGPGSVARTSAVLLAALALTAGCSEGRDRVETESTPSSATASTTSDAGDAASSRLPEAVIDACDVLTREAATQILGPVADLPTSGSAGTPDSIGSAGTTGTDVAVTSCSYLAADRDQRDGRVAVGLVVRTALSPAGGAANRAEFSPAQRPERSEEVGGLGDRAYWAPGLGQLNVLANDQWYVLTYGGLDPRSSTLPEVRRVAETIAVRFGADAADLSTPTEDATP